MVAVADQLRPPAPAPVEQRTVAPAPPRKRSHAWQAWAIAVAVFVLAYGLNSYRSAQAIDINSDEASYAIQSVALYQTGETRWAGNPFFVHPPLFFALEGAYFDARHIGTSDLFQELISAPLPVGRPLLAAADAIPADNVFNAIMAGRQLVAVYGAVVAALTFLLGWRFASRRVGLLAVALLLVDPYTARRNHFNMLEPLTTIFGLLMLATYWTAANASTTRRRVWLLLLTGMFLGLAVLSKELALIYVAPMVVHAVFVKRIRLRQIVIPLVTAACMYTVFPLWTWLQGDFDIWLSTRLWLYQRISGARDDAGITRPGTTVGRSVSASLLDYWPSIFLLAAAGAFALLIAYWYLRHRPRNTGGELLATFVLGIYATLLVILSVGGVVNEQFFYLVMPISMLCIAYALLASPHGWWRGAVVLGLIALSVVNVYGWVVRYGVGSDDSYAEVEGNLAETLPPGSSVIGRDVTDVFMLPKNVVYWFDASPDAFIPRGIVQQKIDYAILNDQDLAEGYAGANQVYYDFVRRFSSLVLRFPGRRWGTDAYQIDYDKVAADQQQVASSLVTGRPAVASSTAGDAYQAANAFDGDFASRWASPRLDEAWIYVDLGESVPFQRVELSWETAFAQSYQLQVSDDAQNWTTFYATDQGQGGYEVIRANAQGRYVRLLMTQRGTRFGYSLYEIEIRATDAGPDAPGGIGTAAPTRPRAP